MDRDIMIFLKECHFAIVPWPEWVSVSVWWCVHARSYIAYTFVHATTEYRNFVFILCMNSWLPILFFFYSVNSYIYSNQSVRSLRWFLWWLSFFFFFDICITYSRSCAFLNTQIKTHTSADWLQRDTIFYNALMCYSRSLESLIRCVLLWIGQSKAH